MNLNKILVVAALTMGAMQVQAHQQGDFIVRAGIANVDPDASSDALALDGAPIAGSEADVADNTQLGLTFTYMLTDSWAVDVLASTPFVHDISADTGALGLGTIDAGETHHLPPTVSLLYFPADTTSKWQPYFGVGLNYTHFFDTDIASDLEGVLGSGDLELEDSFGVAVQAGVDYQLTENLYLNAGVFWIDIDTEATFEFDGGNVIETDVEIDPLVYLVTLGWKF